MRSKYLLAGVLLLGSAACATTPSAGPQKPTTVPALQSDLTALREAIATDLERNASDGDITAASADLDALASIEIPSHPSVDSAVRYFSTGLKPSIQQSLLRSAHYRTMIDRVLDEYGVPRAFAYLPVIESAYLPNITSKAGARGIWQFMPATAREYGLRVDWWIDDRIDPELSTVAAARYLKDLHRMFDDWPLTLAAYNCGPGRVRRTLAEHEVSTFWELLDRSALPKETRGYVPTFFATIAIAASPDTFGFELREPLPSNDQDWSELEIRGPISLEFLAEVSGVDTDVVRANNSRYHRGVVPPGVHSVRLPHRAAGQIADRRTTLYRDDPVVNVATYTLRRGESVRAIAGIAGVEIEDILGMNDVASANAFGPGDSIYLPVRQTTLSNRLHQSRSMTGSTYVVNRGDTLYSIARSHALTVDEILSINELEAGAIIHPGQRLRIRPTGSVAASGM